MCRIRRDCHVCVVTGCVCWKISLGLQAMPGNPISGPEWLDEAEVCSDGEQKFEVFQEFLTSGPYTFLPAPSPGVCDRI